MNILIAYEGTPAGHVALEYAKKHVKARQDKIFLVTSLFGGNKTPLEVMDDAKEALEDVTKDLESSGFSCEHHLLVRGADPGEDIVQFAQEIKADEIIISIKKKSKVAKFLLGSNAQYIILQAPCPVIAVK